MLTEKKLALKEFHLGGGGIHIFMFLGFVGGEGYGLCRKCKGGDCYACKGFEGVTRNENKKDGWVVKVLDKRKTVGGTCWYQLITAQFVEALKNHMQQHGSAPAHTEKWR